MNRYVCVHGHFYQPPRENPWLEEVELEDSAHPYHDWNERITAECYAPNGWSRILDRKGRIKSIVNNYASMSFNFGPTLLSWLERHAPVVYARILEADRQSVNRFSGHGNALAQSYSHMILPLAQQRDVETQIIWGVEDFRHRFGRDPEGMWLPEAAVDRGSLEALAQYGVKFTILSPHQAVRVRPLGEGPWTEVAREDVDPTMPYLVRLPSGRSIAVFFYDAAIARAVAFERLLSKGERVAERLLGGFRKDGGHPQLVSVATDGETYGHHHRHGDMALAYALQEISSSGVAITNYGEYLERHPPTHEVEVLEGSSWSCVHGVERWRSDCGCHSGAQPEWNQGWRAPLRQAIDSLRAEIDAAYEDGARVLFADPWAARDDYIRVVLDRQESTVRSFLADHGEGELGAEGTVTALKLLEMQRHAMLMYTSCGWFFDDVAGIESVQILRYASRAAQLVEELSVDGVEERFQESLSAARSNIAHEGDGRSIYRRRVLPSQVSLARVAAHYAVNSVFLADGAPARVYSYRAESQSRRRRRAGAMGLELGCVRLVSDITWETARFFYGALHLGGHSVAAGVGGCVDEGLDDELFEEVQAAFARGDIPETLRLIGHRFAGADYSLTSLFRDERRRVVGRLLKSTLGELEGDVQRLFEQHAQLIQFLVDGSVPLPKALRAVAEITLEAQLRELLAAEQVDVPSLRRAWETARRWGLVLDESGLGFAMQGALGRAASDAQRRPAEPEAMERFQALAKITNELGLPVDLHKAQNVCHGLVSRDYARQVRDAQRGDRRAERWVEAVHSLADELGVSTAA